MTRSALLCKLVEYIIQGRFELVKLGAKNDKCMVETFKIKNSQNADGRFGRNLYDRKISYVSWFPESEKAGARLDSEICWDHCAQKNVKDILGEA